MLCVRICVFHLYELCFELFRRFPVCHRRHADGLRHLQLDVVEVVELLGEFDVIDTDGMVFDGAEREPALFPHMVPDGEEGPQQGAGDEEGQKADDPFFHTAKVRIFLSIRKSPNFRASSRAYACRFEK